MTMKIQMPRKMRRPIGSLASTRYQTEQVTQRLWQTVRENNAAMTKEKAISMLASLSMYDEKGQLKE